MKKTTVFLASLFFMVFTGFASAEYIDNEDGSITDTSTNLIWQKTYGQSINWDTANSYCTQANTGGYYDWRMPTLTELQVLVDPAYEYPCIDPIFACNSYSYWTSSEDGDSAWAVVFSSGGANLREKSKEGMARCVRGATTPPTTCISVGSDLSINIPCVQYNGVQYTIKLKAYTDPTFPLGIYWILENAQEK